MSMSTNPANAVGKWVLADVGYVDPARVFCHFCGRPLSRKYWQVTDEGETRIYCEERHAKLEQTYRQGGG